MILVVGLGNPGQKYEKTRHNLGFRVIDEFAKNKNFPDFKFSKKFNSEISESVLNYEKIILAKPQTFMNNSGKAVKKLIGNWKIESEKLFVIHDDIDLNLGKIKVVKDRGAAGHKGVQSIINEISTKNFIRFRIGIWPKDKLVEPDSHRETEIFVLENFSKEEEKILDQVASRLIKTLDLLIKKGFEKTASTYNK